MRSSTNCLFAASVPATGAATLVILKPPAEKSAVGAAIWSSRLVRTAVLKSLKSAANLCAGMMPQPRLPRNVQSTCGSTISSVLSSMTLMDVQLYCPAMKLPTTGDCEASNVNFTSLALIGVPSLHSASGSMLKV